MIILASFLLAFAPEQEGIRRVHAHLLIEDPESALTEALSLSEANPESLTCQTTLIEALSANGKEEEALDLWNKLAAAKPDLLYDGHLLEEMAWGVLRKGTQSTQYGVRLAAAIGAFLTKDVRAVPILVKMMRDGNAVIRCVSLKMASSFGDTPLRDEIARLMKEEKVWIVRLEAIRAAGRLKMKELAPTLQALVQSEKTTLEERSIAIEALLETYDKISMDEFKTLAKSNRAGLRHLAVCVAEHFQMEEAKDDVIALMQDSHPAVRIAAINAYGLFYREKCSSKVIVPSLSDADPTVAITAAWAALLVEPKLGIEAMEKWLFDSLPENRRLASAALAASGSKGADLAIKVLRQSQDPYVKANLAIGLLGQKKETKLCCDFLYDFMQGEKRMWMIDKRANPLFESLAPSQVRHNDQIPNYPEAQDQMTRLHLASLLALADDPRASEAIRTFLQKKKWGISGAAAATLLHEGDEVSIDAVGQLVNDDDPNVRLQACLVLALFGKDDSILHSLQGAYAGADHDKKLHILEALGRVGNHRSYSFLMGVLREPFPILRVAAASALIQSVNR